MYVFSSNCIEKLERDAAPTIQTKQEKVLKKYKEKRKCRFMQIKAFIQQINIFRWKITST